MEIGSIVKLKDNFSGWKCPEMISFFVEKFGYRIPEKGEYYVVRDYVIWDNGTVSLYFEELENPVVELLYYDMPPCEYGFNSKYFEEVLPPLGMELEEVVETELELLN